MVYAEDLLFDYVNTSYNRASGLFVSWSHED